MAEVASAFVSLLPSAKNFGKSTERQIGPQLNSAAKKSGTRFGGIFARSAMSPMAKLGLTMVGLFAVKKIKDFFVGAIAEAREAQKVSALTAQVIKSTGGAAGVSAEQVGRLASSISNMTGIDDEAIQSGANLLLTFTNLRNEAGKGNDVFNQATATITDMSAALGTDLKGSAIQVGKALNDPVKGITALTRVGVSFTEQQKAQIEAMVASGNTLGAQKLILKELNKEFGGAAAASSTAGEKLKTAFNNMAEAVGTNLLPYLDRAEGALTGLIIAATVKTGPAFGDFKQKVLPVVEVLQTFADTIEGLIEQHLQPFLTMLSGLGGAAIAQFSFLIGSTLVSALAALVGALLSPIALIGLVVGAAVYAYFHFEGFRTTVNNLASAFMTNVVPALQQFWGYLTSTVIPAVSTFAQEFATNILPTLQRFGDYIMNTVVPNVVAFAREVGTNLKPVWDQIVTTFTNDVLPVLKKLVAAFKENWPAIKNIVETVATLIGKWLVFASVVLGKVLPPLTRFAGFMIGTVGPALIAVAGFVLSNTAKFIDFGKAVVDRIQDFIAFVKAVKDKIGDAVAFIKTLPDKAKAALGALGSLLVHAGEELIAGLIAGITNKLGALKDKMGEVAGAIKGFLPGSPVKEGPLTAWNDGSPGKMLMGFLAKGIKAGGEEAAQATEDAAKKIHDKLKALIETVRGRLETLKSDFASLKDSIASAFAPDLFTGGLADFFKAGNKGANQLSSLIRDIKTLKILGVGKGFLAAMLNSGNFQFIHELAGSGIGEIRQAQALFGQVQGLQAQVGQVGAAASSNLPNKIDKTNERLQQLVEQASRADKGNHLSRQTIRAIGRAVNGGGGNVQAARAV